MPPTSHTLYDRLWDEHVVQAEAGDTDLLYVDRHLIHEVTSPQSFTGLRQRGLPLFSRTGQIAVTDHNVPTTNRIAGLTDSLAAAQIETLKRNSLEFGIPFIGPMDDRQGIVHVIGPELGFTLPGALLVCGDSHTSTHGAFGCLAIGIGVSEVEMVLATHCLWAKRAKTMAIEVTGALQRNVVAKDIALHLVGLLGNAGATGFAIEFLGAAVARLSVEGRMTLCNMSIEAGARVGLVGVDECTIDYLRGRQLAPQGDAFEAAAESWRTLRSAPSAQFAKRLKVAAEAIAPQVTWGTSPDLVAPVSAEIPDPSHFASPQRAEVAKRALNYMELEPGTPITSIKIDKVFIGSCTNARIEDLRAAAAVVRGKKLSRSVSQALVVPGSASVRRQAEQEGLAQVFVDAGFEWREAGCSMCIAMNDDRLSPYERCASTSNRNFEGRQGHLARTHLVSPVMAAAAAIAGHFVDVRELSV